MRQIKFRAWDKEFNKMFDWSELLKFAPTLKAFFENEDIVKMQYTGLKDKNGREIYEGDIVMQLSERTYDSLTGVVKFIDGSYVIETADGKNGGYLFDEYLFDELAFNVLIGNIYENPELLEGGVDHDSLIRWDEI